MPLQFDMPYEELLKYQGTNPRPDDFETYWGTALAQNVLPTPRPSA